MYQDAVLENDRQGLTTDLLHSLIIRIDIPSCPCALIMLRALIIFNMNSSLKCK